MATPTVPTAQPATPLNPFVVEQPEKLDFRRPEEWKRWFTRCERCRVISGLKKQDDKTQRSRNILGRGRTWIYERAKFNSRKQESHESANAFVTELYRLAETCEYGDLKEELIRDRLVVGLADTQLSEKLQLNAELTLEAAVTAARNSEMIKLQQKNLRPQQQAPAAADAMRGCSKSKGKPNQRSQKTQRDQTVPTCKRCGSTTHPPSRTMCPANGKICSACSKKGTLCSCVLICLCEEEKEHPPSCFGRGLLGSIDQSTGLWTVED
ncbi:hypothetical protein MRX96_038252 [Rhipicephalus microplus]